MRRHHFAELHELSWCPAAVRDGLTDFLEIMIERLDLYGPIRPVLLEAISTSGSQTVVDLCSGAGGPWLIWRKQGLAHVPVTLTDKFPNHDARRRVLDVQIPGLAYLEDPVDASQVQPALTGFRTLFTSFHHFSQQRARGIFQDAITRRQPIGIFEFTYRHPAALLFMLLSPLCVWALTPRMRPRSLSKFLLTYLLPLIPLAITFDGIVSCLRTYRLHELEQMTAGSDYQWLSGVAKNPYWPLPITYFVGYPTRSSDQVAA